MRVLFINAVPYGSTGKIVRSIAEKCSSNGDVIAIYYGWTKKNKKSHDGVLVGSFFGKAIHMILSKMFGLEGSFSIIDTIRLVRFIKKIKPDIINLHIMHSWFINFSILFRYLAKAKIKVVWTFHDCWPFTGHCTHFTLNSCNLWKTGCRKCSRIKDYPSSLVDNSKRMWLKKKKLFSRLESLCIVTPSSWLSNLVKESFLNNKEVVVINNGINLSVFKPCQTSFRDKYGLNNRFIILGVCMDWGYKKGLDIFIELSKRLPMNEFAVFLVGIGDESMKEIAPNIYCVGRTSNQEELAKYYSMANVFLNPTREENFPTVNIEALACGIPVITFDTGGCSEIVDETCGVVLKEKDIEHVISSIYYLKNKKQIDSVSCLKKAKLFDEKLCYEKYLKLFERL